MKIKSLLIIFILLISGLFLSGCTPTETSQYSSSYKTTTHTPRYISIKYRNDSVDINHSRWEKLNTSRSSFVNGAWYDSQNKYMVINLNGTYYHYCGLPSYVWSSFKSASSFGSHFNSNIKGRYDCRVNSVPNY